MTAPTLVLDLRLDPPRCATCQGVHDADEHCCELTGDPAAPCARCETARGFVRPTLAQLGVVFAVGVVGWAALVVWT